MCRYLVAKGPIHAAPGHVDGGIWDVSKFGSTAGKGMAAV